MSPAAVTGELTTRTVVARADGVLWRRTLDGAAVMVPSQEIVCLDRIGAMVWDLVDQPVSVAQVVTKVAGACSVDENEVTPGTIELLARLAAIRAIEASS